MAGKGVIEALAVPLVAAGIGVPSLLAATTKTVSSGAEYASFLEGTAEGGAMQAVYGVYNYLKGTEWGLFDQSGAAIFPNAMVRSLSGTLSGRVSNAPLELGSFTSVNKVNEPDQFQVALSFQGSSQIKGAYFSVLEALKKGTDLVTLRMPEMARVNLNVVNITFARDPRSGADLLLPVVVLQEIRSNAATTYAPTKIGTVTTTSTQGDIQAESASSSQTKIIEGS